MQDRDTTIVGADLYRKLSAVRKRRTTAFECRVARLHVAEPGSGRGLTFDRDARRRRSRPWGCRRLSLTTEPLVVVIQVVADRETPVVAVYSSSPHHQPIAEQPPSSSVVCATSHPSSGTRPCERACASYSRHVRLEVNCCWDIFAGTFCDASSGHAAVLFTLYSRLYVVHMLFECVFCFVQGPRSCRGLSFLWVSGAFTVCVFADSCCCVVYLETVLIAVTLRSGWSETTTT